jgi:hypothetical protein
MNVKTNYTNDVYLLSYCIHIQIIRVLSRCFGFVSPCTDNITERLQIIYIFLLLYAYLIF